MSTPEPVNVTAIADRTMHSAPPPSRPTLLFYCQHAVGMGHLMRALALSRGLSESFRVVFLNGGQMPEGVSIPAGVECVHLPPIGMDADNRLVSLDVRYSLQQAQAERRLLIARTFAASNPQVVLIELFPFGRKKFAGEIVPLLELAHARPAARRPLVISSLRDILVGSRRDQQRHDDRAAMLANRYFDAVLVHADAAFARLEQSFRPVVPLRVPVFHTGFVHDGPVASARRDDSVLVSAGSGSVGGALFDAAFEAHRLLWNAERRPMQIITGPLCEPARQRALIERSRGLPGLTVERSVPSLATRMASAAVSVSQCGYNTALDVLAARVPAVVVPYAAGREDEQTTRAVRLARLGVVTHLPQSALSGASLAAAIAQALRDSPRAPALNLLGATQTVAILRALLDQPTSSRTLHEHLA